MLYAFERFLEAPGYILPENSDLDFVPRSENNSENNESTYKGEF